jgi:hypothetical protein
MEMNGGVVLVSSCNSCRYCAIMVDMYTMADP